MAAAALASGASTIRIYLQPGHFRAFQAVLSQQRHGAAQRLDHPDLDVLSAGRSGQQEKENTG
jgi:hypothetical protein